MSAPQEFYRDGLTGFRALAAGWVMLFHVNDFAGPRAIGFEMLGARIDIHPLLTCGWVGVDLFFVLSGFLLATHLLERLAHPRPGLYRRYFAARVRRVFPAYWAQLAVLVLVAVVAGGSLPAWIGYLPVHLPMLHFVSEQASWAINHVYWTLPIEFAFYLCLPLVARVLADAERRGGARKWAVLIGLYAGAVLLVWAYRYLAWRAYAASPVNTLVWATSQLPGSFDQFMAGVAAAAALRWRLAAGAPRGLSSMLVAAGLAGVVAMLYVMDQLYLEYWRGHPLLYFWHTATSFSVALAVLGIALGGRLAAALFENRAALWLGAISYSIYLWHYPVLRWLRPGMDAAGAGLAGWLLVAVPLILAASALSYYAVERPFLRRK